MIGEGSLKGIGLFALEVMHLISSGKKETLATVEEHFEKKDIVRHALVQKIVDAYERKSHESNRNHGRSGS